MNLRFCSSILSIVALGCTTPEATESAAVPDETEQRRTPSESTPSNNDDSPTEPEEQREPSLRDAPSETDNSTPTPPPPGCAQSAALEIDLNDDGEPEHIVADGCSFELSLNGRRVPYSLEGRPAPLSAEKTEDDSVSSRFEIAPVRLASGAGIAVRFSHRGESCDEECWYTDTWITETAYRLDGEELRPGQPCNESASMRANFNRDGSLVEATVDGCTNRLQIGTASFVLEQSGQRWPASERGAPRGTTRGQQIRGTYRFRHLEIVDIREDGLLLQDEFDDIALDLYGPGTMSSWWLRYDHGRIRQIPQRLPAGWRWLPRTSDGDAFQVRLSHGAVRGPEHALRSCRRAARSGPVWIPNPEVCGPRFFRGYPGLDAPGYNRVFKFDPVRLRFIEARRQPNGGTVDCDDLWTMGEGCAACPFVYTVDERGDFTYRGEILRNIRGRSSAQRQSLDVPIHLDPDGSVRVRLTEEKAETTYLDEVNIEWNGTIVRPSACTEESIPPYCAANDKYEVLRQGDVLDLSFSVDAPPTSSHATIRVWATGFYVPD